MAIIEGTSGDDILEGPSFINGGGTGKNYTFAAAAAGFVQVGRNGAIDLGGGSVLVLRGVTMAELSASDFVFG